MRDYPILHTYRDRALFGIMKTVPWEMLEPHESQARKNHSQSLARLAERGGLSPQEMISILDDKDWSECRLTTDAAIEELKRRVDEWLKRRVIENALKGGGADADSFKLNPGGQRA